MKRKWSWVWFRNWTIIYICNLPVAAWIGLQMSNEKGAIGISIAVLLLWYFGIILFLKPGRFRISFSTGAIVVALSQFFPLIQICCGSLAMVTLRVFTKHDYALPIDSALVGFVLTVVTGQLLAIFSLIIGYPLAWLLGMYDSTCDVSDEISPSKQADGTDNQSLDFPLPPAS